MSKALHPSWGTLTDSAVSDMRHPGIIWPRVVFTATLYAVMLLLSVTFAPLIILGGLVHDLLRRNKLASLRVFAFANLFLVCEWAGILACVWLWVRYGGPFARRDDAWIASHLGLQRWWSSTLFGAARRIWNLELEVEGAEEARVGEGPHIVLIRHAGMVDTLLPAAVIANPTGLDLRYVLDADLLWDPCLGIVGTRLRNVFVRRSSRRPEEEIARVASLLGSQKEDTGILIFPEGARFTPARRRAVIESLKRKGHAHLAERAERLEHVMPPKLGAALELLDRNEGSDVILFAHAGLEKLQTPTRLFDGSVIGMTIRVRLVRIARSALPSGREALGVWLMDQWEDMDAMVADCLDADARDAAEG